MNRTLTLLPPLLKDPPSISLLNRLARPPPLRLVHPFVSMRMPMIPMEISMVFSFTAIRNYWRHGRAVLILTIPYHRMVRLLPFMMERPTRP